MASVAGEVDVTALDGYFKQVYASEIEKARVVDAVLYNRIKFREDESEGGAFNQPVSLTFANGVSYARTQSGAFALNAPVATVMKNASVNGSQILLRHSMDYESAAKSSKSGKAFGKYAAQHMIDMKESIIKRLEIDFMYGQVGLGSASGTGTDNVVPMTTAKWATGIWAGLEGAKIEWFAAALSGTPRADATGISAVDLDNKTVTVSGAVDADANIIALDVPFFGVDDTNEAFDGTNHNSCVGLHKIANNTSGNLFGISSTTYALWRPNTQSANSADLSFEIIQKACAKTMGKGGSGDMICLVSPVTWANLATDLAAFRRYGAKMSTSDLGSENIVFYSQTGKIELVSSIYCWEGSAYVFQPKKFKRLGASDVTFDLGKMGLPGGQIFRHMESNAGVEFRCYSHQALYTPKPASVTYISNIVNS